MQEWVLIGLFLGSGLLIYALGAVGAAALTFLWFPRIARSVQGLLSCLPFPTVLSLSLVYITVFESGRGDAAATIGVVVLLFIPGVMVGWPCAFLTLRALERRVERAGVTAQEIFE